MRTATAVYGVTWKAGAIGFKGWTLNLLPVWFAASVSPA